MKVDSVLIGSERGEVLMATPTELKVLWTIGVRPLTPFGLCSYASAHRFGCSKEPVKAIVGVSLHSQKAADVLAIFGYSFSSSSSLVAPLFTDVSLSLSLSLSISLSSCPFHLCCPQFEG